MSVGYGPLNLAIGTSVFIAPMPAGTLLNRLLTRWLREDSHQQLMHIPLIAIISAALFTALVQRWLQRLGGCQSFATRYGA